MSDLKLLEAVELAQTTTGAFESAVHIGNRVLADDNCFVTALVLRELRGLPKCDRLQAVIERALDFLLCCESPQQPGAFHFYPPSAHPDWLGVELPPDADDTALVTMMLVEYGRWSVERLIQVVETVLNPFRLHYRPPRTEPWLKVGVWMTWLQNPHLLLGNAVDCCVNVNVLNLLHASELITHPAYQAICKMVDLGVQMAGASFSYAQRLVPYYPHPIELYYAIHHAIRCGVTALEPVFKRLSQYPWARVDLEQAWSVDRPICGSLGREIIWTSACLQTVRRLAAKY